MALERKDTPNFDFAVVRSGGITCDLPFGGRMYSCMGGGIGREWGLEGIEEFLETKTIGIRVW